MSVTCNFEEATVRSVKKSDTTAPAPCGKHRRPAPYAAKVCAVMAALLIAGIGSGTARAYVELSSGWNSPYVSPYARWQHEQAMESMQRAQQQADQALMDRWNKVGQHLQGLQDEHERFLKGEDGQREWHDAASVLPQWSTAMCVSYQPGCTNEVRSKAEYEIGRAFEEGKGVPRDYMEAFHWYEEAGLHNGMEGSLRCGMLIESGKVDLHWSTMVVAYENAAKLGSPEALFRLGRLYYEGKAKGLWMDREKALGYLKEAAAKGHPEAIRYVEVAEGSKHPAESFATFRAGADKGDIWSQYKLGQAYEKGFGTSQNLLEAGYWYRKAVLQFFIDGHQLRAYESAKKALPSLYQQHPEIKKQGIEVYTKGLAYEKGTGVQPDLSKAFALYAEAAKFGNNDAMYKLGLAYLGGIGVGRDLDQATFWFGQAATEGDADGMYRYGAMYDTVEGGPKHNRDVATTWYNKAARQGQVNALLRLSDPSYYTIDTLRVEWARKLSDLGNPEGQYRMAALYESGKDVEHDMGKAAELYAKAAAQGHQGAAAALGRISAQRKAEESKLSAGNQFTKELKYYREEVAPKDPKKAFAWYKENAEKGYPEAQYCLADAYANAKGVFWRNKTLARRWLLNSAEGDYGPAQHDLAKEYESQDDRDSALKWYVRAGANGMDVKDKIKNFTDDLKLIRKDADTGYSEASYTLGLMNEYGFVSQKNLAYAAAWYNSVERRHGGARRQLAELCAKDGPSQNLDYAVNYYHELARDGDVSAQLQLIRMYNAHPSMCDSILRHIPFREMKEEWLEKAAGKGNDEAQYLLGKDYEYYADQYSEKGLEGYFGKKALAWYRKSAEQGNMDAIRRLRELNH